MPAARPRKTPLKINRFTVMAMLQAARGRALGLSQSSAYSWGLNRSIFYAAAKRGFKGGGEGGSGEGRPTTELPPGMITVGNEPAYVDPSRPGPYFTIGGKTQTEEDFESKIAARFGGAERFQEAWREAERIIQSVDPATLRSPRGFYAEVYKPRRDQLVAEWTERFPPAADG